MHALNSYWTLGLPPFNWLPETIPSNSDSTWWNPGKLDKTKHPAKGQRTNKGKGFTPSQKCKNPNWVTLHTSLMFVTLQVTRVIIRKILSSMPFVLPSGLSQNHSMGVAMHVNYLSIILHTYDLFNCATKMPFQNLVKHWPS
jgi:hypothetical protein